MPGKPDSGVYTVVEGQDLALVCQVTWLWCVYPSRGTGASPCMPGKPYSGVYTIVEGQELALDLPGNTGSLHLW